MNRKVLISILLITIWAMPTLASVCTAVCQPGVVQIESENTDCCPSPCEEPQKDESSNNQDCSMSFCFVDANSFHQNEIIIPEQNKDKISYNVANDLSDYPIESDNTFEAYAPPNLYSAIYLRLHKLILYG